MTGTQEYAAPEVLGGESPSETSDIWSAGLCLHLMLSGQLPRRREQYSSIADFLAAIVERPPVLQGGPWQAVSEPCKDTLRHCLEVSKLQRPAAMTILEEEWLEEPEIFRMKSTPALGCQGEEDSWEVDSPTRARSFFR